MQYRSCPDLFDCRRDLHIGNAGQLVNQLKISPGSIRIFGINGLQHASCEFKGTGCGSDDRYGILIPCRFFILVINSGRHCGMGINHIARILIKSPDLCEAFLLFCIIAIKITQLRFHFRRDFIFSVTAQRFHQICRLFRIISGNAIYQALQITGDQNIHGRRTGQHEFTVAIVFPCGKEIVKHLVLIGGANQLIDGKPHILRIKRRQNIAEITGGNRHVDFLTLCKLAFRQQLHISIYVINNLGNQASYVNGVRGGKLISSRSHLFFQFFIGKELLYTGLGIIKIAVDTHHMGIGPFLGNHLLLLDRADAVLGVKNNNFRSRHIRKARQGRLPGIPGGCRKNDNFLIRFILRCRRNHQMRKDG